mmetsp:Transcript_8298/g.17293  ORF Transcript_8298/g.17293 Transcript_8298/m.17293 type:complete len:249 (-) Transcript_8298:752-1498(-)
MVRRVRRVYANRSAAQLFLLPKRALLAGRAGASSAEHVSSREERRDASMPCRASLGRRHVDQLKRGELLLLPQPVSRGRRRRGRRGRGIRRERGRRSGGWGRSGAHWHGTLHRRVGHAPREERRRHPALAQQEPLLERLVRAVELLCAGHLGVRQVLLHGQPDLRGVRREAAAVSALRRGRRVVRVEGVVEGVVEGRFEGVVEGLVEVEVEVVVEGLLLRLGVRRVVVRLLLVQRGGSRLLVVGWRLV